ncbi:hypothetical protein PGT21_014116 [Puccinia graminis f. sp. tritici]|uniref:Uncharacterized protein n=1 Tax=Puccinia graminis f. sp. tritici TaxID=56615 RepID=A0A5B0LLL4_PUCGR|nr:hypothetical protein PGT21_014116 [Puccinia graminis f. sp. tritici]
MSRDQIEVGSATTPAPSQQQQVYDHQQCRQSKFPFLANQRPSASSPSSSSTLNPSSAISIANSPSDTNSPRFTANSPPSSHDPSNNVFSMDRFNSLSLSS